MNKNRKNFRNLQKGFSLVELIVVVAIFVIISSIIFLNQNKFSSNILITNVAYKVALEIRKAQLYGIGSKIESENIDGPKFGYGIHFSANPDEQANEKMVFFKDYGGLDGTQYNYTYDPDVQPSEWVADIEFPQGQKIKKVCVKNPGNSYNCDHNNLDIVFVKPNPEAHFTADVQGESIVEAGIVVQSPLGDKCRAIQVFLTGQIAVVNINEALTDDPCDWPEGRTAAENEHGNGNGNRGGAAF